MPKTSFEQVREFHETFNHPIHDAPFVPDDKTVKLRLALILEELTELTEACLGDTEKSQTLLETLGDAMTQLKALDAADLNVDLVDVADALTDIIYVVCGAGHACGINLDECMEEVHRSNMSKLGADGKPIYNEHGKVMKGPDYNPPDLKHVIWRK
jgi:predicted HAD superfamily Cof-like phosphohydrolase